MIGIYLARKVFPFTHVRIIWLIVTESELSSRNGEKTENQNVIGITWKYELHAESTTLCAWSCLPSAASVTSTRASLCKSDENTDIKFGWWLFQRKQNCCTDISSHLSLCMPNEIVTTVRKLLRIANVTPDTHDTHTHTMHKYARIKMIDEIKIETDYAKQA